MNPSEGRRVPRLLERLGRGPLLMDGAMGTELLARGLPPGGNSSLWNLHRPEEVLAVHRAYGAAGAGAILTNTFAAHPLRLKRDGAGAHFEEAVRAGARLAREAAQGEPDVLILGDLGPAGWSADFSRRPRAADVEGGYASLAAILEEEGVDGFWGETLLEVEELELLARGVGGSSALPLFVSMAFVSAGEGYRTRKGVAPEQFLRAAERVGAAGAGVNCELAPVSMAPLLRQLRPQTPLPLLARPSGGEYREEGGRWRYAVTPESFASGSLDLLREGARGVGGCCGVGPEHIRAARRLWPRE